MKVILQEKVANLGTVRDEVNVKPGYARNYLLPYGKALPATAENLAEFSKRRAELEKAAAELLARAQARAKTLTEQSFTIAANASDEGKLFGSVGPREIAEAIVASGIEVEKREVDLPEGPIRQVGEYDIHVHLHSDIVVTIKVKVAPESE